MECKACKRLIRLQEENRQLRELLTVAFRKSQLGNRRSKYNNQHVKLNNYTFDSKKEYFRYLQLLDLQKKNKVKTFEVHPRFDLCSDGTKIKKYEADFKVFWSDGRITIEDCKGVSTPLYKLKKSLMKSIYNIDVCEI